MTDSEEPISIADQILAKPAQQRTQREIEILGSEHANYLASQLQMKKEVDGFVSTTDRMILKTKDEYSYSHLQLTVLSNNTDNEGYKEEAGKFIQFTLTPAEIEDLYNKLTYYMKKYKPLQEYTQQLYRASRRDDFG